MRAGLLILGPVNLLATKKMIVECTRYKIGEGRRQTFIEVVREAARHLWLRCVRYELTCCSDDHEWYTLRIEWESSEQLRRFRDNTAGKAFRQAVNSFERHIQEHRQWELTEVPPKPMTSGVGFAEGLSALPDRSPWNRLYPWIQERLPQKILVEQMADVVNMSPRNFARVFRREFRVPPGEFLDRVRVAAAKTDLEQMELSIEQIATSHGFGSSSTMCRAFHRVLGIAPRDYRERVRYNTNRMPHYDSSLCSPAA
jgi:AraC-like DNA-binding protein